MPCGCGKQSTPTPPLQRPAQSRAAAPPPQRPAQPSMKAGAGQEWILTLPGRLPERFPTRLAADAALKRAGGRGRITPT